MTHTTLFELIFLIQILTLSFYVPWQKIRKINLLLKTYPVAMYPRLYPKPVEHYRRSLVHYAYMNAFTFLVGVFFLFVLINDATSDDWAGVVIGYFVLQSAPLMIIEVVTFRYYKLMREADMRCKRKADLRPRRLFDVVSPVLLVVLLVVYIACMSFFSYISQFNYSWFDEFGNRTILTLINLFFAGIVGWNFYGKKKDPYQTDEDRLNQIRLLVKQLAFMSIAVTLFVVISVSLKATDMRSLVQIAMSLYLQIITLVGVQTLRPDSIDFEVYKEEPAVGA